MPILLPIVVDLPRELRSAVIGKSTGLDVLGDLTTRDLSVLRDLIPFQPGWVGCDPGFVVFVPISCVDGAEVEVHYMNGTVNELFGYIKQMTSVVPRNLRVTVPSSDPHRRFSFILAAVRRDA